MDHIYKNIEKYNPNQKRKILIAFDDIIFSNKKIKGYVRYIFANLFFTSKREHLQNKEKYFLFHFESSFRS